MAGLMTFNPDDRLPALSYPLTPGPEEHPLSTYPQVIASERVKYTGPGPGDSRLGGVDYFTPQPGEELARLVAQERATASRLGRPESYSMVGRRASAGPVTEQQVKDFTTQLAEHPDYGAGGGDAEVLNYIGQLEENYNKFSPENIVKMAIQKGIPAAKVPELVAHYSKFRTPVPDHLVKLKMALTSDRAAEMLGGSKTTKTGKTPEGAVTQKDREFRQYLKEYQSLTNKLMKLEGEGAGLLTDPTKYEEQRTQLRTQIQNYDNLLQTTSPDLYKRLMTGMVPAGEAAKTGEGKKLDKETAKALFLEAGKDKEKARQLAKERGYTLG